MTQLHPSEAKVRKRVLGSLTGAAIVGIGGYWLAYATQGNACGPAAQWLGQTASATAVAIMIFCVPGLPIAAALGRNWRLSRLLIAGSIANILFGILAGLAIKLARGWLAPAPLAAVWTAATALALAAAVARARSLRVDNDLSGIWLKLPVGALVIVAFVLVAHHPFRCHARCRLPDDAYGRLAEFDFAASPHCTVQAQANALTPARGSVVRVTNRAQADQWLTLAFFLRNRAQTECEAKLMRGDAILGHARLLEPYDPRRHSRNYHKTRSDCAVLAADIVAPPGQTKFQLDVSAGRVDALSLINLTPREFMRRLRRVAMLCDAPDVIETHNLSASMTQRLFTHTPDYDDKDIPGGGYTSVEPPLHHHLNSLALAWLGPRRGALNVVYLAALLLAYGICCASVRLTAGRMGWGSALALAGAFMAYTTFVRPSTEGISPDTMLLVFLLIAMLLLCEPRPEPHDGLWLAAAIVLATLTQYYATPFICLALVAHALVYRRWRDAFGWALVAVAAALGVLALRVGVAWCTGSSAALWAELRDQNIARYFGLCREVLEGRLWLLPYLGWNYAHLALATVCAAGLLPLLLPWARARAAAFYALSGLALFAFIGMSGFQRSHYVAPLAVPLALGAVIGIETRRPRARLGAAAVALAVAAVVVCAAAGRDYTGRLEPLSFWCRSSNMARSRYFLRQGLQSIRLHEPERAERAMFMAVLADPEPTVRGVALAALAQGWAEAGQWPRAERAAHRAIESDAGAARAYLVLGQDCALRAQAARAEVMFRRAVAIAPGSFAARVALARLLMNEGRFDEAGLHVRRALEIAPQSGDAKALQAEWRRGEKSTRRQPGRMF